MDIFSLFKKPKGNTISADVTTPKKSGSLTPGRVSVSNDSSDLLTFLGGKTQTVANPSFRSELVPLIRDLFKVNPDMSIAVLDMFKLANTTHKISFPYNSSQEEANMRKHLLGVSDKWLNYTNGVDGLVNKLIVQCLIGGAMSFECVPNDKLDGLSTIVFLNPEDIKFFRETNGVYHPYQVNKHSIPNTKKSKPEYIRLNLESYRYIAQYNDTDEPYGIPPFLSSLDSLKTQSDMKTNIKNLMETLGIMGFMEALVQKPDQLPSESNRSYLARLEQYLVKTKKNLSQGMKDGLVVGYKDEHEFNLNSTTQNMSGVDSIYSLNQQSVANGLGVNGGIIGLSGANSGEAQGVMLSKLISQLYNIQSLASYALRFIYSLELRLAGYNNKGIKVEFTTSTVTDEIKVQQGREYKVNNLIKLYTYGIISLEQFAFEMGYTSPDKDEPRLSLEDLIGKGQKIDTGTSDGTKKTKREADKDKSDRRGRDKSNPSPARRDSQTKER